MVDVGRLVRRFTRGTAVENRPIGERQETGRFRRARVIGRRMAWGLGALTGAGVILGMAGCGYEELQSARDKDRYPPPGQLVDIGGYSLHVYCSGEGETTVVLDAGLGGAALDWNLIQPELAGSVRVCCYDRAGMGWSEPSPEPRTPEQIAGELHRLLTNAGIPAPYVLVGHSLAGKNVRMFAALYPDEVAGMVLVDARSEYVDDMTSPSEAEDFLDQFRLQGQLYGISRKIGLARLVGADLLGFPLAMSRQTRQSMSLLMTNGRAIAASTAEVKERTSSDAALKAAPSLGDLPLVVLAAGENMRDLAFWAQGQQAQADLSSSGRLVVVEDSGHYIQWEHPAMVIDAIREVVAGAALRKTAN